MIYHTKIKKTATSSLIVLTCLFLTQSCSSVVPELERSQFETTQAKPTREKIKGYLSILSAVEDSDISPSYEYTIIESMAVQELNAKYDKHYLDLFITALDSDYPLIRQTGIKQIKRHRYKPAIPKLIKIMTDDPVDEIQYVAIDTLSWLGATSACNAIEQLTKQSNYRIQSRTLSAMTTIPCPNVSQLLLSYFRWNKSNNSYRFVAPWVLSLVAKTKSEVFIPHLIKMTYQEGKANSGVLSALQKIGGQKVEDFFSAELKKTQGYRYKDRIVDYMLLMNKPEIDDAIMNYIDRITDDNARDLVYIAIKNNFRTIERRKRFVDRLLKNYEKEKNNKIKQKITTMLEDVIDKKHIKKIQILINNEKDQENKCRLVRDLSQIATNKQYDFLIQFDSLGQSSTCYKPVIIYLGNLKNNKANNYLLSKHDVKTDKKILYLRAVGQYKSKKNRTLLFDLLNSKNADLRYVAAKGLPNQSILNDWEMINALYTKEKDKEVAEKLLYIIAMFNHKESLDIIKRAYSTRLYSTARKILEKKGFTNEQILALRNKNKK